MALSSSLRNPECEVRRHQTEPLQKGAIPTSRPLGPELIASPNPSISMIVACRKMCPFAVCTSMMIYVHSHHQSRKSWADTGWSCSILHTISRKTCLLPRKFVFTLRLRLEGRCGVETRTCIDRLTWHHWLAIKKRSGVPAGGTVYYRVYVVTIQPRNQTRTSLIADHVKIDLRSDLGLWSFTISSGLSRQAAGRTRDSHDNDSLQQAHVRVSFHEQLQLLGTISNFRFHRVHRHILLIE